MIRPTGEVGALVRDMQEAGWRLVPTGKGHLKAVPPDGAGIQVISVHNARGRTVANQRARFERWRSKHPVARDHPAGTAPQELPPTTQEEPMSPNPHVALAAPMPTGRLRHCDRCDEDVDTGAANGKGWQIHAMQHRLNAPADCPDCDWNGTYRRLSGHRRQVHGAELTVAPRTPVAEPVPTGPAQAHDDLPHIVDDLLSVVARLDAYARELHRREAGVRDLLDAVRKLAPELGG